MTQTATAPVKGANVATAPAVAPADTSADVTAQKEACVSAIVSAIRSMASAGAKLQETLAVQGAKFGVLSGFSRKQWSAFVKRCKADAAVTDYDTAYAGRVLSNVRQVATSKIPECVRIHAEWAAGQYTTAVPAAYKLVKGASDASKAEDADKPEAAPGVMGADAIVAEALKHNDADALAIADRIRADVTARQAAALAAAVDAKQAQASK